MPALEELELDGNPLESLDAIPQLVKFNKLESINMSGCPIQEELGEEFVKEMLILLYDKLPNLKSIND